MLFRGSRYARRGRKTDERRPSHEGSHLRHFCTGQSGMYSIVGRGTAGPARAGGRELGGVDVAGIVPPEGAVEQIVTLPYFTG